MPIAVWVERDGNRLLVDRDRRRNGVVLGIDYRDGALVGSPLPELTT